MLYRAFCVVCVLLSFSNGAFAATNNWERIVDDYITGKDVRSLLKATEPHANDPAHKLEASAADQLNRELTSFVKSFKSILPGHNAGLLDILSLSEVKLTRLARLEAEFAQLQAQHLLYTGHLSEVESRLLAQGNQYYLDLFTDRKAAYLNAVTPFITGLESVFERLENYDELSGLEATWSDVQRGYKLYSLYQLVAKLDTPSSAPVLRAFSTIPYEVSAPLSLPLEYQTGIVPSYLSQQSPSADSVDLQASDLAPFTDEILKKAQDLEHDPIKIFNFVRDTVTTEWYYGSMKGAAATLSQSAGNDIDQAALLVALLRASGMPARFVHGAVDYPISGLQSQMGIQGGREVLQTLRTLGMPVEATITGQDITSIKIPYTWVSVQVPYSNYRGAIVDGSGKVWLGLMPAVKSIKPVTLTSSALLTEMSFNIGEFYQNYLNAVQAQSPLDSLRDQAQAFLTQQQLGEYTEFVSAPLIQNDKLGYLPNSLPLQVEQVVWEQASVPEELIHHLELSITSASDNPVNSLLDTLKVPDIAGRRLTISYMPGSIDEQALVNSFGGIASTPAYLISLLPQIKLDGKLHSVGNVAIPMGRSHELVLKLKTPFGEKTLKRTLLAGSYHAIAVSAQGTTAVNMEPTAADTEYTAARLLSQIAHRYNQQWETAEQEIARLSGRSVFRALPAIAITSNEQKVVELLGVPQELEWAGVSLDAIYRAVYTAPAQENAASEQDFMRLSGLHGSYLEHQTFEELFKINAISADKGIALATEAQLPVLTLTSLNIEDQVGAMNHSNAVIEEIRTLVNNGFAVTIPQSSQSIESWQGSVWIANNSDTGASGYFIAGALAGGSSTTITDEWPIYPANLLAEPYGNEPNINPYSVRKLIILDDSGLQAKAVGSASDPLRIKALDEYNRPVVGAKLHFNVVSGLGGFGGSSEISVVTDILGRAEVLFQFPESTQGNSVYYRVNQEDKWNTKVGVTYVDVAAEINSSGSLLEAKTPFQFIVLPGEVANASPAEQSYSASFNESAQLISVRLSDAFGNPVSNAAVNLSVGEMRTDQGFIYDRARVMGIEDFINCSTILSYKPLWRDGCGGASAASESDATGAAWFKGVMGPEDPAVTETAQVFYWQTESASGVQFSGKAEYVIPVTSSSRYEYFYNAVFPYAAKAGESIKDELSVYTVTADQDGPFLWGTALRGAGILGAPNWELFETFAANTPGDNDGIMLRAATSIKNVPVPIEPGADVVSFTAGDYLFPAQSIFAVDTYFVNNGPLSLDVYGSTVSFSDIKFRSESQLAAFNLLGQVRAPYRPVYVELLILEEGNPVYRFPIGSEVLAEGSSYFEYTATIPKDIRFDVAKSYQYQIALDRGSDASEVLSDPVAIEFQMPLFGYIQGSYDVPEGYSYDAFEPIFEQYNPNITTSVTVDLTNSFVCKTQTFILYELTRPARVIVEVKDENGLWITLSDETLPEGKNETYVPVDNLQFGVTEYRIRGVQSDTGMEEVHDGLIRLLVKSLDNLPVGHAFYESADLFDGHVAFSSTDFSIPGRGKNLEFIRSYSSNNTSPSPLGMGWSHNWDSYVRDTGCGSVEVRGGSAGGVSFFPDGQGGYRPSKGYHSSIVRVADGWDFFAKDGTRYHYKKYTFGAYSWYLEFIEDTNGNITKLAYNPSTWHAELNKVEDPSGRTLTFEYERFAYDLNNIDTSGFNTRLKRVVFNINDDGNPNKSFEVLFNGRTRLESVDGPYRDESFTYSINEADGFVPENYEGTLYSGVAEIQRATLKTASRPEGEFTYTWEIKPMPVAGATGPIASNFVRPFLKNMTGRWGGLVEFDYGDRTTQTGEYTSTVTLPNTAQHIYTLDNYGAMLSLQTPAGTKTYTWYTDDILMESMQDEENVLTQYQYDDFGNLTYEKTGNLNPVVRTYTQKGYITNLLETETDRNGYTTERRYDSRGNLTKITYPQVADLGVLTESFSYNSKGDRISYTDRNGEIWLYGYDKYGNLNKQTTPDGIAEYTDWNIFSRKTRYQNGAGKVFTYKHDLQGFPLEITDAYGTKTMEWNIFGSKTLEKDADNRTWKWEYNTNNQLTKEIKPDLTSRELVYDNVGNLDYETDFRGNITDYDYNLANFQTDVYYPVVAAGQRHIERTFYNTGHVKRETDEGGRWTEFEYDDLYRVTNTYRAYEVDGVATEHLTQNIYNQDDLQTTIDAEGNSVTYVYDTLHRKREQQEPLSRTTKWVYDGNGNVTQTIDALGNAELRKYNKRNLVTKITDREGYSRYMTYTDSGKPATASDERLNITSYTYDDADRLHTTKDPKDQITEVGYYPSGLKQTESLPNGNTVTYYYDANARLQRTTDLISLIKKQTYTADDQLETEEDGEGYLTTHVYDARGQKTEVQQPGNRTIKTRYDLVGNVAEVEDAKQQVTKFEYDLLNRVFKETDPLLNFATTTYDKVGNKKTVTDKRGNTTTWVYDDLYRVTDIIDPEVPDENGNPVVYKVTFDEYDLNGNVRFTTDKRGVQTENQYDKNNRLRYTYRDNIRILENEYDEAGNLSIVTDAENNKTAYEYDERNQQILESRPLAAITRFDYDAMGNQDYIRSPEGRVTNRVYDLRNRLDIETNHADETTRFTYYLNDTLKTKQLPKGNTWTYSYDTANRLYQITAPADDTGAQGLTTYLYDNNDNLTSQQDAEQKTTTFDYDALNRRLYIQYPDTQRFTFDDYDANGNLTVATDPNGLTMTYDYDALNRETLRTFARPASPLGIDIESVQTRYDGNNNVRSVTEHYYDTAINDRVTRYAYDNFDRLQTKIDSFGQPTEFGYDLNGVRTRITDADNITTQFVPDELNRISQVINAQGTTQYLYYRDSRLKTVNYPNTINSQYTYDLAGRVDTITNRQNSALVSSYDYDYDSNGNRTEQIEINGAAAETTTYGFDGLDRLTSVTYPDQSVTYTYDLAYNRKTETAVDLTATTLKDWLYQYNDRHQLTDIQDQLDAAQSISYGYDNNGNQVSKTKGAEITNFVFDARDDMRQVQVGGSTVGQFLYDAAGLRIEKAGDRGIERYTYDDLSVLRQFDENNQTLAKFDYGPDRLLSLTGTADGTQFYLMDALNSVVNLANASGAVQARYQYDAWGNKRNEVGSSWNRFGFTGHEHDTESGLIYAKARFYDPETGRFLGQDAWEGDNQLPPSLHKYLYAYQNPTVWVDPDGNAAVMNPEQIEHAITPAATLGPNALKFADAADATYYRNRRGFAKFGDGRSTFTEFVARNTADLSAPTLLLVEEGDSFDTLKRAAYDALGDQLEAPEKNALEEMFWGAKTGQVLDLSPYMALATLRSHKNNDNFMSGMTADLDDVTTRTSFWNEPGAHITYAWMAGLEDTGRTFETSFDSGSPSYVKRRARMNATMEVATAVVTGSVGRLAQLRRAAAYEVSSETTIKLSQVRALRDIGVNKENRRAFFNGEMVDFSFPTKGGDDVVGFLEHLTGNAQLTSQLFSINNTVGGAPSAFRKFIRNSVEVANTLDVQRLEIQGASLINDDLAEALLSRGFKPKTVPVPESLGGGSQEVLYKVIDLTKKQGR